MNLVEQQFERLRQYYIEATITRRSDGTYLVSIPGIPLPVGWTKSATTIHFIVPVGYPMAQPDCFWSDFDLRLSNGQLPQNTNVMPLPLSSEPYLWFSWHLSAWHPNSDNLLTYINVIRRRLQDSR
jgi:hypothetical protein